LSTQTFVLNSLSSSNKASLYPAIARLAAICIRIIGAFAATWSQGRWCLSVTLDQQSLAKRLRVQEQRIDPVVLTIESGFTQRRRGVEAKLVLDQAAPAIDRTLSRNLALGWSWFDEIKLGASMKEVASRNGISQRAIARLIDLAFLAPDIVDAIIVGRQPVNLTTNALIRAKHQRLWHDQRAKIAAL
jgi:site-specific DNA recombinase